MATPYLLHPRTAQLAKAEERPNTKPKMIKAAKEMQAVVNEKAKRLGLIPPPYEFLELIGKGSFGRVFKSKDIKSSMIVAVKIVDADKADSDVTQSNDTISDFMKETRALRTLKEGKAQNINVIFDAFAYDTGVWIISEYCPGGSVHTLMKASAKPGLDEKYIVPIARELAEAVKWVHASGIIHRDIKAANVLISEEGNVQLCDFGVSAMLEHKVDKRSTVLGTPWWMAPELAVASYAYNVNISYGKEVDIWAYGCTLYELATGFPPNCRVHPERLGAVLLEKVPRLEGESFSPGLCELVALCLEERADNRPLITNLQRHYYIFNSQRRFPTSSLRRLVQDFYSWEQSGGQRQSLFMAGGAPVAEMHVEGEEEEDAWNFSTTDSFDQDFITPENTNPIPTTVAEQSTSADRAAADPRAMTPSQMDQQMPARRGFRPNPRAQLHPLQRMFDENDSINYAERHLNFAPPAGPPASVVPTSDLPFRNQTPQQSSVRDTTIDLGEWDPTSGNIHIPDFSTIRDNKGRYSRKIDDEDDFQYTSKDDDEYKKRNTRDWKFPSFDAPAETRTSIAARPKTQDWKFPAMIQPTLNEDEEEYQQDHPFGQLPNLAPAAPLRPRLIHQETAPVQQIGHGFGSRYQETASAPVSPPESMIDLDEAERTRPTTSHGSRNGDYDDLYEASDYAPSDETSVFGLERHLMQPDTEEFEPTTVRSSSLSAHRQSRSVPPELDISKSDIAEGSEPVAAAPQARRRQSSLSEADRTEKARVQQARTIQGGSEIFSDKQGPKWEDHTMFGGPSTAARGTTDWRLPSRVRQFRGMQGPDRLGFPNQSGTIARAGDLDYPGLDGPTFQEYAAEGFPSYQRVVRSLYQGRSATPMLGHPGEDRALENISPEVVRMREWVDGTTSALDWTSNGEAEGVSNGSTSDKGKGKAPATEVTPQNRTIEHVVPTILRREPHNGAEAPNLRQFVPPMPNPPSAEVLTEGASADLVSAELDRLLSEHMRGLEGVMGAMQAVAAREQYLARQRLREGKGKVKERAR